jgi:D-beta-D-heptose 7-phosphate kinase/D-beta-D-heptose 1-phosphate adenosyltransferase
MLDRKNIFVIGDLIVDEYIYCNAVGLSLESPTVKSTYESTRRCLGGSGNVVENLLALNRSVGYMTINSDPTIANQLRSLDGAVYFALHSNKKASVKQRYYLKRKGLTYKHLQINHTDDVQITKETENDAMLVLSEVLHNYEAVILSDYRCGLLTPKLINFIVTKCKAHSIPVIVNTQLSDWGKKSHLSLSKFKGCDLFILNEDEAVDFNLPCNYIKTLGENGCVYKDVHVDGVTCKIVDTCGAGDSFTAIISTLDWESNTRDSLTLANIWAGLSTEIEGATPPSMERFKQCLKETQLDLISK